ncbi:MAG: hypothetical protein ACK5KM_14615 [Hyphomicrobiaceae bacterium]
MQYPIPTSAILTVVFSACLLTLPVQAEVRFGKNVRIGGHDVSGQTFNKKKRGRFYIYKNKPRRPGCYWRKNADGSRTKICHWKRKR